MKPVETKVTTLDDGRVKVSGTFAPEDVESSMRMAYRMLAYNYEIDSRSDDDIPGLLGEKVGDSQVDSALTQALPSIFAPFILDSLDFYTILDPEVIERELPMAGASYTLEVIVTPRPSYELSSYDAPVIQLPKAKFDEEEVDGIIASIAMEFAEYEKVEEGGRAQLGDQVVFDLETNREFGPVPFLTGKGKVATIGEGWLAEEFDRNLFGTKVGQKKNFTFQALTETSENEEDFEKLYASITVQEIWRPKDMEIDDAWVAEHIPDANTLDELRALVQENMIQGGEKLDDERKALALVAEDLAGRIDAKIPDALYEYVINNMLGQMDQQATNDGKTFDDYLKERGLSMDTLGDYLMRTAKSQIIQGFALDAWARHYGLEATDKDIDEAISKMVGSESIGSVNSYRRQFEVSGRGYILREAAERLVANKDALSKASVEYVD